MQRTQDVPCEMRQPLAESRPGFCFELAFPSSWQLLEEKLAQERYFCEVLFKEMRILWGWGNS